MTKAKLEIDFPDDRLIHSQIQKIVSEGIKPKESFLGYLKTMYHRIGLKYLFHDVTEIAFTFILVISVLLIMYLGAADYLSIHEGNIYTFIFICSPLLYLALALVSFVNSKHKDTYTIEMTCKHNIYQLAAFRMLVFSIVSMIANALLIFLMTLVYYHISIVTAFMISTTSLFLFSILFLYGMVKIHTRLIHLLLSAGWLSGNVLLLRYSKEFYDLLLVNTPTYVYLGILIGCIYIYIRNLNKLISYKNLGVVN